MSHPSKDLGSDDELPPPELNPLLNPLLSLNMGRWAEVYFTSPPEKRDEAVQELLRELRAKGPAIQSEPGATEAEVASAPSQLFSSLDDGVKIGESVCPACGERESEQQRFCGRCGAALNGTSIPDPQGRNSLSRSTPSGPNQHSRTASYESQAPAGFDYAAYREQGEQNKWQLGGYSPQLMPEYERSPYRYRLYIGAVLLAGIGFLVYTGWRKTTVWSGDSHALPQAPVAESQPASHTASGGSPPPQAAETKAPGESQAPAASQQDTPRSEATREQTSREHTSKATREEKKSGANTASPEPAADAALRNQLPPQGGQEGGAHDLAVAERYLKGEPGKARDSSEAAKWLWQSVRKENTAATLMLSDLYLRGDGVPKNCDQARLLLDAAARRGAAGAAERLRNMRAFGCE